MAAFGKFDINTTGLFESMVDIAMLPYAEKVGEEQGKTAAAQAKAAGIQVDMVSTQFESMVNKQKTRDELQLDKVELKKGLIDKMSPAERKIAQDDLDDDIKKILAKIQITA